MALIVTKSQMKNYLNLETIKPDEVPEDFVVAVTERSRESASLKLSKIGKFFELLPTRLYVNMLLFCTG